jgi:hypothetical protein
MTCSEFADHIIQNKLKIIRRKKWQIYAFVKSSNQTSGNDEAVPKMKGSTSAVINTAEK